VSYSREGGKKTRESSM